MMKKPKSAAAQAVTANVAGSGRVVFRTPSGAWSPSITEAHVVTTTMDAESLLAAAMREADANIVVEPYLIEVTQEDGAWRPTRLRELIRTIGPTFKEAATSAAASA